MFNLATPRDTDKIRRRDDTDFDKSVVDIHRQIGITQPLWYDFDLYGRLMQAFIDRGVPANEARIMAKRSFEYGLGNYDSDFARSLGISPASISESSTKANERQENITDLYHMTNEARSKDVLCRFSGRNPDKEQTLEVRVCEYISYVERHEKASTDYNHEKDFKQFALSLSLYGTYNELERMEMLRFDTPEDVIEAVFLSEHELFNNINWNDKLVASILAGVFGEETVERVTDIDVSD